MKLKVGKNKALTLIAAVLIILSMNFFQGGVKSFFYNISSPLQNWFWQAGDRVSDVFGVIPAIKSLQEENENLALENQRLMAELVLLREIREENTALRDALRVGLEKEFQVETAKVISKDLGKDSVIVDKGSKDGLSKNMPVINQQGVAVGRIDEVYANRSRVVLISSKNSSFDAEVSETGATGLLKGQGNGRASLELLPKDIDISKGDLVVSSVLSGIFPPGLLAGSVAEVQKNDANPFQKAEVQLFFAVEKLRQIFIILDF